MLTFGNTLDKALTALTAKVFMLDTVLASLSVSRDSSKAPLVTVMLSLIVSTSTSTGYPSRLCTVSLVDSPGSMLTSVSLGPSTSS